MKLFVNCGIFLLNLIYGLLKCLPQQEKILYISRQMNVAPIDFILIKAEMEKEYPCYKNVILTKTLGNGVGEKIRYIFHMLRQMYHLATAKIVLLDTYCIAVSVLKHRDTLTIIQMWHALGALKKFGYSILDKPEGRSAKIAACMKMHNNYSYVFTSSEYCRQYYSEAFRQPLEKIKVFPLPRIDIILNKDYQDKICEKIYKSYPRLKKEGKKVIVYAPTFRKRKEEFKKGVQALLEKIDYTKYELIIKLHPIEQLLFSEEHIIFDDQYSSYEMFLVADYIITDYSAVIFEGMLFQKPIFLYAFDYDTYNKDREFYVDYLEFFKGIVFRDSESLLESIDVNDIHQDINDRVISKMIKEKSESYTKDICNFLIEECIK